MPFVRLVDLAETDDAVRFAVVERIAWVAARLHYSYRASLAEAVVAVRYAASRLKAAGYRSGQHNLHVMDTMITYSDKTQQTKIAQFTTHLRYCTVLQKAATNKFRSLCIIGCKSK